MSAEPACRETTAAKWPVGTSIFEKSLGWPGMNGEAYHRPSAPPELVALRRAAYPGGAFVLVAKDQSAFLQIIG